MAVVKTRKPKTAPAPKTLIAAPDAPFVYLSGERPGFELAIETVTETTVTFKYDSNVPGVGPVPVRKTKEKTKRVKLDRTEHFTKEFPAGETVLATNKVGAAVAEALKMIDAGLKNVRLYTLDGSFLKKFTPTDAKKVRDALDVAARVTRREEKLGLVA